MVSRCTNDRYGIITGHRRVHYSERLLSLNLIEYFRYIADVQAEHSDRPLLGAGIQHLSCGWLADSDKSVISLARCAHLYCYAIVIVVVIVVVIVIAYAYAYAYN